MTLRAVGFGRGFPRLWLLPIVVLTLVLGAAVFGVLSRSIVADLLAWWPVWLGLGVAAYLLRDRQFGAVRAAGLVPLAALGFVLLFTWGHLAGWAIMPSASQRLVGPGVGEIRAASLAASIDGQVDVVVAEGPLYRVEPVRRGGPIGVPTSREHLEGSELDIELVPPPDPGLYTFAGWVLTLAPGPEWSLQLDGAVDADFSALDVSAARFDGVGTVVLGAPTGDATVSVAGSYRIVLPRGSAARVIGVASVPATWVLTDSGAESPTGGEGWAITVVGDASLSVVER